MSNLTNILFVILSILVSTSICSHGGGTFEWYQLTVAGSRPDGREGAAWFVRKTGDIVLFGGYQEVISVTLQGPNVFFNDVQQLTVTFNSSCGDPHTPGCTPETAFYTWVRLHNGTQSAAPAPRSLFCWAYDPSQDALFVYGGANYTNTFSSLTFYNDTWKFDFGTLLWTQLFPTNIPFSRGGTNCARVDNFMYMFGGAYTNSMHQDIGNDELWKFNLNTYQWIFVGSKLENRTDGGPWPGPRLQNNWLSLPGTDKMFLTDGFIENLENVADPYNDIWIYDVSDSAWTSLANTGHPLVKREYMAAVALSSRYVLFQGGDAQGNRTAADICKPPLLCFVAATPTDNTFIYDIKKQRWTELYLDREVPPLKRAQAVLSQENLVLLFGGYNFDGNNGIGTMRDRHTWALEPSAKYFRGI